MEEALSGEEPNITEQNLLSNIWLKPAATLAYILENCPKKYVLPLLMLGGIFRAIDRAALKDMGDKMPTVAVLTFAILGGGLLGWITYYIYAWAMSVTGRWIKGSAEPEEFRTVIAWALIPSICTLFFLIPKVIIFGDDLFRSELTDDSLLASTIWFVFGLLELILNIWTAVILVKGISIIQNFSTGKSLLNIVLPGLVIVFPILSIMLLFKLFSN